MIYACAHVCRHILGWGGREHFLEILEVPLEFCQCLFHGPPLVQQIIVFKRETQTAPYQSPKEQNEDTAVRLPGRIDKVGDMWWLEEALFPRLFWALWPHAPWAHFLHKTLNRDLTTLSLFQ